MAVAKREALGPKIAPRGRHLEAAPASALREAAAPGHSHEARAPPAAGSVEPSPRNHREFNSIQGGEDSVSERFGAKKVLEAPRGAETWFSTHLTFRQCFRHHVFSRPING